MRKRKGKQENKVKQRAKPSKEKENQCKKWAKQSKEKIQSKANQSKEKDTNPVEREMLGGV
jgi:hypothetical protein